jgi:hypothetical protein
MNIFHLDWVAISSVVIVLLLILLISVKLYKHFSRWRGYISHSTIETKNLTKLKSKLPSLRRFSTIIFAKKKNWKDFLKAQSESSLYIIIGDYWFQKLQKIFIESLCTYGQQVISLTLFPRFIYKLKRKTAKLSLKETLSTLISYLNQKGYMNCKKYSFIDTTGTELYFKSLFCDPTVFALISINPKITKSSLSILHKILSKRIHNKWYCIFSHYSYLFLKNRYQRRLETHLPDGIPDKVKIVSIKNARYSFRNYETILLGEIIHIVKENV